MSERLWVIFFCCSAEELKPTQGYFYLCTMKRFFKKYGAITIALFIIIGTSLCTETEAEVVIWAIYSVTIIVFVYIMEKIKNKRRLDKLQKEKVQSEIGQLKNQLNPHFFFNTLNNLYSLSLTEPEKTPQMLLKLSELMRYTIYKGKEELIALIEEIKYIKNYLDLHRIRHKNEPIIQLKENLINGDTQIPPLLFIVLVENAIKHGVEKLEDNAFVTIDVEENDQNIIFNIVNNFEPIDKSEKGIGLDNLKRRLKLEYPNAHKLEINESGTIFSVKIQLDSV